MVAVVPDPFREMGGTESLYNLGVDVLDSLTVNYCYFPKLFWHYDGFKSCNVH